MAKLRFTDEETPPEPAPKKKRRVAADNGDCGRRTEDGKQQFDEQDAPEPDRREEKRAERIEKLEEKSARFKERAEQAQDAIPTQKKKSRKHIYDEAKGKAKSKLVFEDQPVPIGEAKWNNRRAAGGIKRARTAITRAAVTKAHAAVHRVEHENVGVHAAHRGELLAESAYRGGKRTVQKAYRFHKNKPYRQAAKAEVKSLKAEAKLRYHKALQETPKKKNAVSRYFHKRRIKRQYAKAHRRAKKTGAAVKKSGNIIGKVGNVVTKIVRRNPIFLGKVALLGLLLVTIMAMFSMCMNMFSGGTGAILGGLSYTADYEDIDDASILYTELETDLQIYLRNIETNYPGFDEYRFSVDDIGHNPLELMAFLTAVYGEFTFAEVEPVLRALFAEQYTLTLTEEVEIRTRTEIRTDEDGNEYTVEVEYEWRILHVTLDSTPMIALLIARMDMEQRQHFNVLMASRGARQLVGNPFDFGWLSQVSSLYGYRIHPIHGDKRMHWGIDIGQPTGIPILAGFDGTVSQVGYDPDGWGNFIVIDDGSGLQALYAHCHTILVPQGASVEEGQPIATVGNTGASTGPHLHMEVIRNGRRLNPIFFVMSGEDGGFSYGNAAPMTAEQFAILYAEARSHLGTPYVFGANGPNAFDCSSFVCWVFTHSGIYHLPRTTAQGIFNQTTPIPLSEIQPGDIIFFQGTYSTPMTVTHVGIYVGGGQMIHAGRPVSYASIHTPFWTAHFYAVGRLNWAA